MSTERSGVHRVLNPQHSVNDASARLVAWHVAEGQRVELGAALCDLETTKAAYEVAAPAAGFVKRLRDVDDYVAVNQELALIFETETAHRTASPSAGAERRAASARAVSAQITDRARALAESLGVDLAEIQTPTGIIREQDVRAHHGARQSAGAAADERVAEAFLRVLRTDIAFRDLPSDEKIRRYRENGARIGEGVVFAPGAVVVAEHIDIGERTVFGEKSMVTAERFRIGALGVIGARANMLTRTISLGDAFYSGSDVIVGGGGAFGPRSEFRCGHACLVSSQCIINTAEAVVFGDEVGLSPRVQIYTHSHWQNVFEGYPASFGPVTVGDHSYLTGNVMVVPGVTIGRGCTALASSVVAADVDDRAVVSGVPAAVVGHAPEDLPLERKDRIMQRLVPELKARLSEQRLDPDGFVYARALRGGAARPVVLTFDAPAAAPAGTTVFDFTRKQISGPQNRYTDEIRNFFRKRGVRFKPYAWRYVHDAGLFNE